MIRRLPLSAVGAPVDGGELGRGEAALEVDADQLVPLLLGHVEDHALSQNAVGADEDIEVAEGVDRCLDGALGGVHVGDVAGDGDGLSAVGDDLVDDGLDPGRIHAGAAFNIEAGIAGDDRGALLGEDLADLRAHAAGASGDQCHLAIEVSHVIPQL